MSVPFGIPEEEPGVEIYRVVEGDNPYAIINSTPFYHPTCSLRFEVVDEDGNPVPEINVYVYAFNFGALRPIARVVTDEEGLCSISIGEGNYFVSGGTEEMGAARVIHTLEDEIITCQLILGEIDIPESFWLHYPLPE